MTAPHDCVPTLVNGKWWLSMPPHRAERAEWQIENGGWEVARLDSMAEHIGPGSVVYDIGSEEGEYPALAALWGARAVAVEPNPKVWPCLRATWQANHDDDLLGWYVGFCGEQVDEQPPMLDIDATPIDGWPACAYGPMFPGHGFRHLYQQQDATPTITLDELVKRIGVAPTHISIDIEGSELVMLRGAKRTLVHHRPVVWVSVHPEFLTYYGQTPEDLDRWMDQFDYERSFLAEDHERHVLWSPR